MSYELTAYETPYAESPKKTTVIGTLDDAKQVAEGLLTRNYEVYVRDSDGRVVADYVS